MPRATSLPIVAGLIVAICAGPAGGERASLSFGEANVGALGSNKAAELSLPPGTGPFPAVVVLHGCNGVSPHTRAWARRLVSWGYAALIVDSFRPRGITNVCGRGMDLPPGVRARDALAGAAYLRTLPTIDATRIAAIGFSHGGWTALFLAPQTAGEQAGLPPWRAIVAFYPWCGPGVRPLATDVLILIGDADDWTPAARCVDLVAKYATAAAHRPVLKVYPGAKHSFDASIPDRVFFGHRLGYDAPAAGDAIAMTRQFLDERLR